ncbi:hypothetical protein FS837_007742, partial [Tulasnella sp. UAMH 9824]
MPALPGDKYGEPLEEERWELILQRRHNVSDEFIAIDHHMGRAGFSIPHSIVEAGVDFIEELRQQRTELFINAAINNDAVSANIERTFVQMLNSPETGLVDERSIKGRWLVKHSEQNHSEIIITDLHPDHVDLGPWMEGEQERAHGMSPSIPIPASDDEDCDGKSESSYASWYGIADDRSDSMETELHLEKQVSESRRSTGEPEPALSDLMDFEETTSLSLLTTTPGKKTKTPRNAKTLDRLERNAARTKDFTRLVPSAIVVEVRINGRNARALVDSGSLADFMSTRLVDQLKVRLDELEKPMAVQLAVTGSRTVVNNSSTVEFEYQGVRENRRFNIINLENYNIILGTPFLFQHKVGLVFNPSKLAIGSEKALPMEGEQVAAIPSRAADVLEGELDKIHAQLRQEAKDLCKNVDETDLPPFRAVNYTIPLIDEDKVYTWRPSKCPEAMRLLRNVKCDQYLKSGRWRFRAGSNASPLLILWKPKPGPDGTRRIRTV